MKGAAKCDKHCELQNSVNRQGLERILCFWDIPKSMPASVSTDIHASDSCQVLLGAVSCACLCVKELRAFDAFNALVLSTTSNLISTFSVFFAASLLAACLAFLFSSRHEVRSANPLNLSI